MYKYRVEKNRNVRGSSWTLRAQSMGQVRPRIQIFRYTLVATLCSSPFLA